MAYKISINRGESVPNLLWNVFAGNPHNEETISKIKDNVGEREIPVTSIPSPFAQMHLFETAFRFINEAYREAEKGQGNPEKVLEGETTYHRIVSHCLDLYELMYNYDVLGLRQRISVLNWNDGELDRFAANSDVGRETFAGTLRNYIRNYNQEGKRYGDKNPFRNLLLIRLDSSIIGGTSPLTGFFTLNERTPKDIQKLDASYFFQDRQPLHKRDQGFQKFLNWFFESSSMAVNAFPDVHRYIKNSREHITEPKLKDFIRKIENNALGKDEEPHCQALSISNNPLFLLGKDLQYHCEKGGDPKEILRESDYAIRSGKNLQNPPLVIISDSRMHHWKYYTGPMPADVNPNNFNTPVIEERELPKFNIKYPCFGKNDFLDKNLVEIEEANINSERFKTVGGRECQNLLPPIKPAYFDYFTLNDLETNLSMERLQSGAVSVKLTIPVQGDNDTGSITFERLYSDVDPAGVSSDAKGAIVKVSFGLGIYPFFRVSDNRYNDFYKIAQFYDNSIERLHCSFLREDRNRPQTTLVKRNLEFSRTRKEEGQRYNTQYTELATHYLDKDRKTNKGTTDDIRFDVIGVEITAKGYLTECVVIPKWGEPKQLHSKGSIAFDIGTSNTYVTVAGDNGQPETLSSSPTGEGDDFPHLVFLHEPASGKRGSEKYDYGVDNFISFLPPQMSELMPSVIGSGSDYEFPIRTIINQDNDTNPKEIEELSALVNLNIPFAIEQFEMRQSLDKAYSHLKWGTSDPNSPDVRNRLHLFIDQVALMGRTRLLEMGVQPDRTDVIWFKPLSMNIDQATTFKNIWWQTHLKYFAKTAEVKAQLYEVTESWAPYFSHTRSYGPGRLYLNVDIGGGTSDFLLFKDGAPLMTSSFRFAGDHLYEDGLNKNVDPQKRNGIFQKYLEKGKEVFKGNSSKTRIINYMVSEKNLRSSDLMMFFLKQREMREVIQLDKELQLLFLLHHSALFYHAAQIVKMSGSDMPDKIGLSGNGARLLEMTNRDPDLNRSNGIAQLISTIFGKVFETKEAPALSLEISQNPKHATAAGGIIGLPSIKDKLDADQEVYHFALGDDHTLIHDNDGKIKKNYRYEKFLDDDDHTVQEVTRNVMHFLEFFFEDLWYDCGFTRNFGLDDSYNQKKCKNYCLNESNIQSALRLAIQQKKNYESQQVVHETMFFYPIRAIMYDISMAMVDPGRMEELKS